MAFHSKLGVHVQKLIYEIVPFACFLCLKAGHKANQCPRVDKKKSKDLDTSMKAKKKSKPTSTLVKGNKKLIWRWKPSKQLESRECREDKKNEPKKEGGHNLPTSQKLDGVQNSDTTPKESVDLDAIAVAGDSVLVEKE